MFQNISRAGSCKLILEIPLVNRISFFFLLNQLDTIPPISVLGALLGTQNGREVEIVNTFELAVENDGESVDHAFLISRRDQCTYLHQRLIGVSAVLYCWLLGHAWPPLRFLDKQVFPSLEFIGWYTVALRPTSKHIALHEQARSWSLLQVAG